MFIEVNSTDLRYRFSSYCLDDQEEPSSLFQGPFWEAFSSWLKWVEW